MGICLSFTFKIGFFLTFLYVCMFLTNKIDVYCQI